MCGAFYARGVRKERVRACNYHGFQTGQKKRPILNIDRDVWCCIHVRATPPDYVHEHVAISAVSRAGA